MSRTDIIFLARRTQITPFVHGQGILERFSGDISRSAEADLYSACLGFRLYELYSSNAERQAFEQMPNRNSIKETPVDGRIIKALRAATRVVVFTGAGVSAESGVPTFRDRQTGLWENFDAGELATPFAFQRDPPLVWGWYEWRRATVLAALPNAGHRAIAAIADRAPHFTLITQNVDDLHERAGSTEVLHLHGELSRPSYLRLPHLP